MIHGRRHNTLCFLWLVMAGIENKLYCVKYSYRPKLLITSNVRAKFQTIFEIILPRSGRKYATVGQRRYHFLGLFVTGRLERSYWGAWGLGSKLL
jgi:hypothetical protein